MRNVLLWVFFLGIASPQLQAADATLLQQVFVVKQAFPNVKTIGVLCHTIHAAAILKEMGVACTAYQLNLRIAHTETLQDVREGFERMVKSDKIDMIWVLPDDVTDQKFGRRFLSEKCMLMKIPLYVHSPEYVREGALLAVAPDGTGALRIYFNAKVGEMLSLTLPAEVTSKILNVE